jgi:hypothetical protein
MPLRGRPHIIPANAGTQAFNQYTCRKSGSRLSSLSDSHIFAAMIAAINALNSFFLPSSRRKPGPRLSTGTQTESLDPDVRRDDEKMKCLPGWPSILWICKEIWREVKLKKICAYDSDFRRDDGNERGVCRDDENEKCGTHGRGSATWIRRSEASASPRRELG